MRPQSLEEFLGQTALLGPGKPLRVSIESGSPSSMVFWGPPGCGKTTLAHLIAVHTDCKFELFSAVTEGVPRVREIIAAAKTRRDERGTILFCDEIHRFNKAQQDAFLPAVEEGIITLIGATTENPSFALNSALISRLRVFVLEPIPASDISIMIERAWQRLISTSTHCNGKAYELPDAILNLLAAHADGDGRRALNATEALWNHFVSCQYDQSSLTDDAVQNVLERRMPRYDRDGEQHFNIISALHKSVRGSDVQAALYWFARMIEAGEDPLYIVRRMVRIATEDIGLADPRALTISLAAKDAFSFLGSPEGELAIVEALIYLATAPKSNRAYAAWNKARAAAKEFGDLQVPLHIRNAPTRLMRDIGYGAGYRYDHDEGGLAAGQRFLPEDIADSNWYMPSESGLEKKIAERIRWWNAQRNSSQ